MAQNNDEFMRDYVAEPKRTRKHSICGPYYSNTGYRLSSDETGTVRSYSKRAAKPLFYVDDLPHSSASTTPTQQRHEHNIGVYQRELARHLAKITQPRLRLKTRVAAWRNALAEWHALVDYAKFHGFDEVAATPQPQPDQYFTPKLMALAALEGHNL